MPLIGLIIYAPVINNGFVRDDFFNLDIIRGVAPSGLLHLFFIFSWYMRPLPYVMIWAQYQLFGTNVLPWHLFNILLHSASALLLLHFLTRMGASRRTATVSAFLFLLSPIGSGAVTWLSGTVDVMVLFFILLAIVLYATFLRSRSKAAYIGALLATFASILTKEEAIVLILIIPVMDLLFSQPAERISSIRLTRSFIKRGVPFVLGILIYFVFYFLTIKTGSPLAGLPRSESVKIFLKTIFVPFNPDVFPNREFYFVFFLIGFLHLFSITLAIIRWQKTSHRMQKIWLFFMFLFFAFLLPVNWMVFVKGMHYMADSRYLYLPAMCLIVLTAVSLLEFYPKKYQNVAMAALALLTPFYIWGVFVANHDWQRAAQISDDIFRQIKQAVPDLPANANVTFENSRHISGTNYRNSPLQDGVDIIDRWSFSSGLNLSYNRDDLVSCVVDAEGCPERSTYLFYYDEDNGTIELAKDPDSQA